MSKAWALNVVAVYGEEMLVEAPASEFSEAWEGSINLSEGVWPSWVHEQYMDAKLRQDRVLEQ